MNFLFKIKSINFDFKNAAMKVLYATPLTRYVLITYILLITCVRILSLIIKSKA